jgi:hypothetical protein
MLESIYKGTMVRNVVLKDKLLSILNSKLSKYEECENCMFTGILELDEENEDGCNWIGAKVELICGGETAEKCRPFVSKVLSEAGKQYNIKNKMAQK